MIDLDQWRAHYAASTYAEQTAFYADIFRLYPQQKHHSIDHVAAAFDRYAPQTVVELGGWDGELAAQMLAKRPDIESWVNVEISRPAVQSTLEQMDPRYSAPELDDWYWTKEWSADLFLASHCIEHLTADDLDRTLRATSAKQLFLDAPLADGPTDWHGYLGTHILEVGWRGVDELCAGYGYRLAYREFHVTASAAAYER